MRAFCGANFGHVTLEISSQQPLIPQAYAALDLLSPELEIPEPEIIGLGERWSVEEGDEDVDDDDSPYSQTRKSKPENRSLKPEARHPKPEN